jgi:hypothetical protein
MWYEPSSDCRRHFRGAASLHSNIYGSGLVPALLTEMTRHYAKTNNLTNCLLCLYEQGFSHQDPFRDSTLVGPSSMGCHDTSFLGFTLQCLMGNLQSTWALNCQLYYFFHRPNTCLFVVCLTMLLQLFRLHGVECKDNRWMMNWKGYGRKRLWPNFRYHTSTCLEGLSKTTKTSVRIACIGTEIWTRHLPNTKQKC